LKERMKAPYVETNKSNLLLVEVDNSDWVEIADFSARLRA
jgi:hypothetical protein